VLGILQRALELPAIARVAADPKSAAELRNPTFGHVRVRQLGGEALTIRPGTSDATVVRTTFTGKQHLPPVTHPALILDLGANIGSTMAHMAHMFPDAIIAGVELDPDNFALCEKNVAPWADRVRLIEAAVWVTDGSVHFQRDSGRENGSHIADQGPAVRSVSMSSLVAEFGPPDYVKMDIEGAERDILRAEAEWAAHVRSIKVELHGRYTPAECIADLTRLGFRARVLQEPWWPPSRGRPCVIGLR
jgi:FkbM family methyltransferase